VEIRNKTHVRVFQRVFMQNGAHGKVQMCARFNNLNLSYRHIFMKDKP